MTKRKNSEFAFEFENIQVLTIELPTFMLSQYGDVQDPYEPHDELLNDESEEEFIEFDEISQPVPYQ
jgi:hypothetical protein